MQHLNLRVSALLRRTVSGVFLIFLLMVLLTGCAGINASSANSGALQPQGTPQASADAVGEGGDLLIPIADITQNAGFYPIQVDGAKMESLP